MTEDERYLFDLNGYLILRGVLSEEEVRICNEALDDNCEQLSSSRSQPAADQQRMDFGDMLTWERPWCEPFREFLAHPTVRPYLLSILGLQYRIDHGPGVIAMNKGVKSLSLHGGGVERPNLLESYFFKDGRIYTGLTVVEFILADEGPGDGGLCVVPGSHKANLRCPDGMKKFEDYQEHVKELNAKAGDAIIFTETLTHGSLAWTADHQRRALLYKFSPGYLAYGSGHHQVSYPDYYDELTDEQREVLEHPHMRRP
jgi:hypothetical protein